MTAYFKNIKVGISTLWEGLQITLRHLKDASSKRKIVSVSNEDYFRMDKGIVTTEYPFESIPVPDHGRYRLHNEVDDCIVCDLCAKICPVNCIEIDPVKSPTEISKTSDGSTKKIFAATFKIDMAKCCYCGLCTTVCPTECLTMTKTYDYSEYDIRNMVYDFSELTEEQTEEKRKLYEAFEKQKAAEKAAAKTDVAKTTGDTVAPKIGVLPKVNPVEKKDDPNKESETSEEVKTVKPVFKPKIQTPPVNKETSKEETENEIKEVKAKPVFKPVIKTPAEKKTEVVMPESEINSIEPENKPAPKPVFKPVIKAPEVKKTDDNTPPSDSATDTPEVKQNPKPVFKPIIKPPKKEE